LGLEGLSPNRPTAGEIVIAARATGKYVMTISRLTIDKLGVKLYDRVSAVIAELVANAYDADATKVTIEAPMWTACSPRLGAALAITVRGGLALQALLKQARQPTWRSWVCLSIEPGPLGITGLST
jgi:hypothetical protein